LENECFDKNISLKVNIKLRSLPMMPVHKTVNITVKDICKGRYSNTNCSITRNNHSINGKISFKHAAKPTEDMQEQSQNNHHEPSKNSLNPLKQNNNCLTVCKNSHKIDENDKQLKRLIERLNENFEKIELKLYEREVRDIVKKEWRQLAIIIDRLMLVIFVILTVLTLVTIFNQRPDY
jgi:hypothetical protein